MLSHFQTIVMFQDFNAECLADVTLLWIVE